MIIDIAARDQLIQQLETHKAMYISILQLASNSPQDRLSLVQKANGEFSEDTLNAIMKPEYPLPSKGRFSSYSYRRPTPMLISKIAKYINLPSHLRDDFQNHALKFFELDEELKKLHQGVAPNSSINIELILQRASHRHLIGQLTESLYDAKYARQLLQYNLSRTKPSSQNYSMLVRAYVCEIMNYRALGLFSHAYNLVLNAHSVLLKHKPDWLLILEKGQSLIGTHKRWTLKEIEKIVIEAEAVIQTDIQQFILDHFRVQANLAFWRRFGTKQKQQVAEKELLRIINWVDDQPNIVLSDRVTVMTLQARLSWELNRFDEWEYYIRRAMQYAKEGNVLIQVNDAKNHYKESIYPVLDDLNLL